MWRADRDSMRHDELLESPIPRWELAEVAAMLAGVFDLEGALTHFPVSGTRISGSTHLTAGTSSGSPTRPRTWLFSTCSKQR